MNKSWHKGSFTVEAAIWMPVMVLLITGSMKLGIDFFQNSKTRESYSGLIELDIVQEFYNYQILGEIGEAIFDD